VSAHVVIGEALLCIEEMPRPLAAVVRAVMRRTIWIRREVAVEDIPSSPLDGGHPILVEVTSPLELPSVAEQHVLRLPGRIRDRVVPAILTRSVHPGATPSVECDSIAPVAHVRTVNHRVVDDHIVLCISRLAVVYVVIVEGELARHAQISRDG